MNKQIVYIASLILLSQVGVWIQQFAQVKYEWFRNNSFLTTVVIGVVVSFGFVEAAKVGYDLWESTWKVRLLQFAIGVLVFWFMSWFFLEEGLTTKTSICLFLSFSIIAIQIFWK
jgi:hypothetical protein